MTLPSIHDSRGAVESTTMTRSPGTKLFSWFHFWCSCSSGRYSRIHRFQKRSEMFGLVSIFSLHRDPLRLKVLVGEPVSLLGVGEGLASMPQGRWGPVTVLWWVDSPHRAQYEILHHPRFADGAQNTRSSSAPKLHRDVTLLEGLSSTWFPSSTRLFQYGPDLKRRRLLVALFLLPQSWFCCPQVWNLSSRVPLSLMIQATATFNLCQSKKLVISSHYFWVIGSDTDFHWKCWPGLLRFLLEFRAFYPPLLHKISCLQTTWSIVSRVQGCGNVFPLIDFRVVRYWWPCLRQRFGTVSSHSLCT